MITDDWLFEPEEEESLRLSNRQVNSKDIILWILSGGYRHIVFSLLSKDTYIATSKLYCY